MTVHGNVLTTFSSLKQRRYQRFRLGIVAASCKSVSLLILKPVPGSISNLKRRSEPGQLSSWPSRRPRVHATFNTDIPVFLYGSLMVPEVLGDALRLKPGSLPEYESAMLPGYSRYKVLGASFPAIVPLQESSVVGCLVNLRTALQAAALDDMEGALYTREIVRVRTSDRREREAYAYVWKGREDELTSDPWDIDTFIKERRSNFG